VEVVEEQGHVELAVLIYSLVLVLHPCF